MGKRILVIDDEELVVRSIMRLLAKEGYSVVTARSGEEAIKQVKEAEFDLIISDIRMPQSDGIEVILHIRDFLKEANRKPIPEILITGYADLEKYNRAMELKIADHIYKPFDSVDFLSAVKRTIG